MPENATKADLDWTDIPLAAPVELSHLADLHRVMQGAHDRLIQLANHVSAQLKAIGNDLEPDNIRQREREIRQAANDKAVSIVNDMRVAAATIKLQKRNFTPAALCRRARFDPDPVRDAIIRGTWIAHLSKVSEQDLIDFALDAKAAGSAGLALAHQVLLEARSRSDLQPGTAQTIQCTVESIIAHEVAEAERWLAKVAFLEESALRQWRILRSG